ncbi:MAG TPA: hypothetical protein VF516_38975, partial [Kofleriaceae bacterium]
MSEHVSHPLVSEAALPGRMISPPPVSAMPQAPRERPGERGPADAANRVERDRDEGQDRGDAGDRDRGGRERPRDAG